MIEEYFRIGSKNLMQRKTRSLLTVLGILLGIMTIFVLMSLSLGLREFVNEQFELLGSDTFFIQPKGQAGAPGSTGSAVQLTLDDFQVVERVKGIEEASYMAIGNAKIEFNDETRYYMNIGLPNDDSKKLDLVFVGFGVEEGRMLKKGDRKKVMVGYNYRYKNLFSKPVRVGDTIKINDVDFEVVAVIEAVGNPGDDQQIYIGYKDFQELYNSGDRIDYMMVKVQEGEDLNKVADEVNKDLMDYRNVDEKTSDFTILTPEELMATFGQVLNGITGFLFIIAFVSAVVGGIGIANTMYTSVLERNKEIGTMKAIGARNSDILWIFVVEAGILGLIGGALGVGIGIVVAKTIEYVIAVTYGVGLLRASLNPLLIIGSLGFGFFVGILSGFVPSYQASKLKPVDTLRYE